MTELKPFLHGLPAFERFSDRQLDALVSQLTIESHPAGTVLLQRGEQGRAMFIVISGVVGVTRFATIDSGVEDLIEMRTGEVLGRLSLMPDMPSPVTCRALEAITVVVLTPARYHALFILAPAIAHQFQYMLAAQLAQYLQIRNQTLRKSLERQAAPSLLERLFGVKS